MLIVPSLSSPSTRRIVNLTSAFAAWQQGADGQPTLVTGLAEPAPMPPTSPLRTCKDNTTIDCFCVGRQTARGVLTGFAASPFDASGSSYLGCSAIGQTQVYFCPAGSTFVQGRGCLQAPAGTDAPGTELLLGGGYMSCAVLC